MVTSKYSNSYCAFLSGTPVDKMDHITNFMRLFGIIRHRNLYTTYEGDVTLHGIEEMFSWAKEQNFEKTNEYIERHPFRPNKSRDKKYIFDFFINNIEEHIFSMMPLAMEVDENGNPLATYDCKNGFYKMDERDAIRYTKAIGKLSRAAGFNAADQTVNIEQGALGGITKSLVQIQLSKAASLARVARELLKETYEYKGKKCKRKIILFADYYEIIDFLMEELEEFSPLRVTGKDKAHKKKRIQQFKENNDNHRILIGNMKLCSKSLNLQDFTGEHERVLFIMPNYFVNELQQASYRTFRMGAVGLCQVRFFYGLGVDGISEVSILSCIAKRGKVMSLVLKDQKVKFPGEYENIYEIDPETEFGAGFKRSKHIPEVEAE
jgi:hypothetical protein